MPIATPSRKWSYAYHERHILTWRFTKRQVGMPYECWLLQAAGNCWINRELKTDLGLGAHQVSGEEGRIEQSFGIAVLAYLLLIRACHQEMLPGTSWSIAQLQYAFRLRIMTNQVEHNVKTRLAKARKVASSLALDR